MGWIVQEYEQEVHVVPDTEPGHVLEPGCGCTPQIETVEGRAMVVHRDREDRELGVRAERTDLAEFGYRRTAGGSWAKDR